MIRIALSAVAAFFISNVFNTVYYGMTAGMNHLDFTREEPIIGLFVANHALYAVLLAYLYPRFRQTGTVWSEGAWFGFVTALLMFLPTALIVRGAWEVPVNQGFAANTGFALFTGTVIGIAIAAIQNGGQNSDRLSKSAS